MILSSFFRKTSVWPDTDALTRNFILQMQPAPLCVLHNDKYILDGFTSISNNLPQHKLGSQLKALKLEGLKAAQPCQKRKRAHQKLSPTTKIMIEEVVKGEIVRGWAGDRDADLEVPSGQGKEFDRWRRAESVGDDRRRATFCIARDRARITWQEHNKKRREGGVSPKKPLSQLDAWKRVRTAIADPKESRFLAHTDATACLSKAFGKPELADLPVEESGPTLTRKLPSPLKLSAGNESCVRDLEHLVKIGSSFVSILTNKFVSTAIIFSSALL